MKKLFCSLGFILLMPLAISGPAGAATAAGAIACSRPRAMHPGQAHTVASLVDVFAPPEPSSRVPPGGCAAPLDPLSRELLLAALRQADSLSDPLEQSQALQTLALTYSHFELPQALPLLDQARLQSRRIPAEVTQLQQLMEIADQYRLLAGEGDRSSSRGERETVRAAFGLLRRLAPGASADLEMDETIFRVANWYAGQLQIEQARLMLARLGDGDNREYYAYQIEDNYAHALAQQGDEAAAIEHRKQHLPPEWQAAYAEERDYEQIAVSFGELPPGGAPLDAETLAQSLVTLGQFETDGARYAYGQMLAQQLVLAGQYDAALEALALAPIPAAEMAEAADPAALELGSDGAPFEAGSGEAGSVDDVPFDISPFAPAILASNLAIEGDIEPALGFIDRLPAEEPTRLLQRGVVLTSAAVYRMDSGAVGAALAEDALAQRYLDEAIAIAGQLSGQPEAAGLWLLIGLAQLWGGERLLAEQSMAEAIARLPQLEAVIDGILAEQATDHLAALFYLDPVAVEEPGTEAALSWQERYRQFRAAIAHRDLAAAEALLPDPSETAYFFDMQGALAAAYSQAGQAEKALQLLSQLFALSETAEAQALWGDLQSAQHQVIYTFALANGRFVVLQQALGQLDDGESAGTSLLAVALEVYSYSRHGQDETLAELLQLRDAVLPLPDSEAKQQLLMGLLPDLVRQGGMGEAIALTQQFSTAAQVHAFLSLAMAHDQLLEPSPNAMLMQLVEQVRQLPWGEAA